MIAAAIGIFATTYFGAWTDRIGRRPVYMLGTAIMLLWGIPLFLMVNTGSAVLIVVAFVISYSVCQNSLAGVQGAWFSELFNAKTRTTGASLAYQLSAVVSGFTPLIATALYIGTGWIGPAILFSVYGLLGLIAALVTRETWGRAERDEVAALERAIKAEGTEPAPRRSSVDQRELTSCPTRSRPPARRRGGRDDLADHPGGRPPPPPTAPTGSPASATPPTGSASTPSTWARCRARATSGRRSASPTSSPWSTPTSCGSAPTTRTGPAATGSCSRSATTPSRCTRRWPRPGSSRSRSCETYGSDESRLPMSGMASYTPGMEISGGSLGHGLAVATGMALGLRHQGNPARVYNLLSDGELDEGSTWEAALQIAHHGLDNVTAIVDVNALQADGPTAGVLRTEPVLDKWQAFGWHALRVDGNDIAGAGRRLRRAPRAHAARPGC